jgi:tripartite-type tricarboxylate transporter receptor subunit TctC
MPSSAVRKLSVEVVGIMASPLVEERVRAQGFRVDARPADSFAPFLEEEIQRWSRVIKAAEIRAD